MKPPFRVKAYTDQGIIQSKLLYNEFQVAAAYNEIALIQGFIAAYVTNGLQSKRIDLSIKQQIQNVQSTRLVRKCEKCGKLHFSISIKCALAD